MDFSKNGVIATLSLTDRRLLKASCEVAALTVNQSLAMSGAGTQNVYFLAGASVAVMVPESGMAVGLIGIEGAVGLQFALGLGPSRFGLLVQTHGPAWVITGLALRSLVRRRPPMLLAVARYLSAAGDELGTFAAAIQNRSVSQRLARWILRSQGNAPDDLVLLTHAHMARMLGVRRATVSAAAKTLSDRGLLRYSRGRILVLDRRKLQLHADAAD